MTTPSSFQTPFLITRAGVADSLDEAGTIVCCETLNRVAQMSYVELSVAED